jgi:HlyD family secretion protein
MTIKKFFIFLGMILVIALVVYIATTPRGNAIELTGVLTGNDVIVSPQIQGRLQKLLVDEGSQVKAGQLIAEVDPTELQTVRDAAAANIRTLQARLLQSDTTRTMNDAQTSASEQAAQATLTATRAQLEQAQATLALNDLNYKRDQGLFEKGVVSAQDRDTSEANLRVSQATVKSLEDQVRAAQAQLEVAQANRKQVEVGSADIAAARAQIAQATAQKAQAETQLGYTKIYAPIDGIVSVRVARQGEVVQAGGPIVTIVDIDHLWVQTDVEESLIDSIQFGQKLKVRLPSGDEIEGAVFFKGVESDFATQRDVSRTKRDIKTFAIKVSVPNPSHRLFAGMTATVLLPPRETKDGWFHRPATLFAPTLFTVIPSAAKNLLFSHSREKRQ